MKKERQLNPKLESSYLTASLYERQFLFTFQLTRFGGNLKENNQDVTNPQNITNGTGPGKSAASKQNSKRYTHYTI